MPEPFLSHENPSNGLPFYAYKTIIRRYGNSCIVNTEVAMFSPSPYDFLFPPFKVH